MIETFFCGPGGGIFATYHPPAGAHTHALTVICPPLFSEYMRTHLALRELAIALADRGQHVVRFDYRGTGDSLGELDDVTVSDWLEDVALAVREARELSGSAFVHLLGIRAGALLACKSAGGLPEVRRLVLWDPVADGASWLEGLRRVQAGILRRNPYASRSDRRDARFDHGGHHLSAEMVEELCRLDGRVYASVPAHKLRVVRTSPGNGCAAGVAVETANYACNWETDVEETMLPQPIVERLAACLLSS